MKRKDKRGFVLVEVLIAIAITAVLAAVILPGITADLENARRAADTAAAKSVQSIFNIAYLEGDIEFETEDGAVWIFTTKSSVKYCASGAKVLGETGTNAEVMVKKLLSESGYQDDDLFVHANKAVDNKLAELDEGWKWYCVYIKGDGTTGASSGPGNADENYITEYDSFKTKALYTDYEKSAIVRALKGID